MMSVLKRKVLLGGAVALLGMTAMSSSGAVTLDPGYREVDAEHTLVIDTTKGRVIVEMYPQLAPAHVERMTTLARQHFYDGLIFHRVIEDFMAQTGDPKGTGEGGSTLPNVKAEFLTRHDSSFPLHVTTTSPGAVLGFVGAMPVESQVPELAAITKDGRVNAWGLYCQGVLGMARDSEPDSANSQFFLMRAPNSSLEKNYTAFGVVVSGLDVVRKIKIGVPAVNPDQMTKVQVLADMPENERPRIAVMDTASPEFKAVVDRAQALHGVNYSPCDITVPVKDLTPATTTASVPATTATN